MDTRITIGKSATEGCVYYRIHKKRGTGVNLRDYEAARTEFTWEAAAAQLDGLPGGGLNMAHEAVDRHARGEGAGRIALRHLDARGGATDWSYGELSAQSSRFANLLAELGLSAGDRVYTLLGRVPELFIAALGTLKHRCVFCPLFSAFGPEPIRARMSLGEARVLVTTAALYRQKIAPLRGQLPALREVLLVGAPEAGIEGARYLAPLLERADAQYRIPATDAEAPALLHFTSGTTGRPKGAVHVHQALVAQHVTARLALDLGPEDVYWCTADPGWITGVVYGVLAPLAVGATLIVDEGEFDAERWYDTLERERVSVWYTAPTALRMLMRLGNASGHRLEALRLIASVGEPLNPEVVRWSQEVLGKPCHDTWWQTETGAIAVANFLSMDIKPGSMGRPVPGVEAAIVSREPDGRLRLHEEPGTVGELALRGEWPAMFRAYICEEERYRACFVDGWYLSGDLARCDADGYYWFIGRSDDVIKTAGHLVGPFEVESVLLEHATVGEAGVIGLPDPLIGETVKAFVELKPGYAPSEVLRRELLAHARRRLGPAVAPRAIEFAVGLPRTRSGKIMRRLLRARELGLPEGDLSTLETPATPST